VPISGSAPAAAAARRFRPALWPSLAAGIVIVATVLLGNWQARRAEFRGSLQEQARAMAEKPPLALASAADATPDLRYRPAIAEGEFVADRQILLDNRTYKGTVGYHVLAPLKLDAGGYVLVDRGWIAATPRREPPAVPAPSGRVRIEGRLNVPPARFIELKHLPPAGNVWQNLDLDEYARVTGLRVASTILEQAPGDGTPATHDALVRDWPAPDLGRDKNIGYMWQWYSFAALTAVLWIVFSWRRE